MVTPDTLWSLLPPPQRLKRFISLKSNVKSRSYVDIINIPTFTIEFSKYGCIYNIYYSVGTINTGLIPILNRMGLSQEHAV